MSYYGGNYGYSGYGGGTYDASYTKPWGAQGTYNPNTPVVSDWSCWLGSLLGDPCPATLGQVPGAAATERSFLPLSGIGSWLQTIVVVLIAIMAFWLFSR